MWYKDLFTELEKQNNVEQSEKMSAYMQNKFPFLGVPKPKLKELVKPYLKEIKKQEIDWEFINFCWSKDYREAQYVALDYLSDKAKKLTDKDLSNLKKLIITKSWWETVDNIDALIGIIVLRYPKLESIMLDWSTSDNIWLKRVSINFQQEYKEKTNTELLEKIICNNFGSEEFFINKAIGWSLRDYSKVDPAWVKDFIEKYKDNLSKLSIKEASKCI